MTATPGRPWCNARQCTQSVGTDWNPTSPPPILHRIARPSRFPCCRGLIMLDTRWVQTLPSNNNTTAKRIMSRGIRLGDDEGHPSTKWLSALNNNAWSAGSARVCVSGADEGAYEPTRRASVGVAIPSPDYSLLVVYSKIWHRSPRWATNRVEAVGFMCLGRIEHRSVGP